MIADEISEKTNGKFTMEIHENGSLMTQEGEVDAVARGSLDMMFSSPFSDFRSAAIPDHVYSSLYFSE